VLAVLFSTLVLAAADPPPAAPDAATAVAEPAKPAKAPAMVCHNEKPTGSHFIERVCVTPEEAAKAQQAAQDTITGLNRRPKASDKPPK
jgi:hypothetical protein